ncbi:MAG TPA: replication-associated recombination protein A [Thermodesulfobacteriota bacterium]
MGKKYLREDKSITSLFSSPKSAIPLAERIRPRDLTDFVGQNHLVGDEGTIRKMVESGKIRSMILWGPAGTGKTTLARIIANKLDADFFQVNAISSGVKEMREIISHAKSSLKIGRRTILLIDEIHRFNKAQQAALLQSVEDGTLILIGATTENPSFEVISPLLSRCYLYILETLGENDLEKILNRALEGEFMRNVELTEDAKKEIMRLCGGDARVMLNALELAISLSKAKIPMRIEKDKIREAYQVRHYKYDKSGEDHYNTISAFIKSIRGSDPDAAMYYLARMLEAGEDPKFIARRLIILASEDIGNAEPYALTLATACFTAVDYVGLPEALIILAQTTTYLSSCLKSNASFLAIQKALIDVREKPYLSVPIHLRSAPTELMRELRYGRDYMYAHEYDNHFVEQQYLPEEINDKIYYEPTDIGKEGILKKYLEKVWKKRRERAK